MTKIVWIYPRNDAFNDDVNTKFVQLNADNVSSAMHNMFPNLGDVFVLTFVTEYDGETSYFERAIIVDPQMQTTLYGGSVFDPHSLPYNNCFRIDITLIRR